MTSQDAEQIAALLERRFGAAVDLESTTGNGRYQFAIVSPQFSQMTQLARQDAVWDAIAAENGRRFSIDIAMILTFSPEEFAEAQESI